MKTGLIEKSELMNDSLSTVKVMQAECENWKRMLEVLMHENVDLKTRLAAVVKENGRSDDFVTLAEQFQNNFMREDEVISLARRDVAEQEKLLLREVFEDGLLFREVTRKQKRLRKELQRIENGFNILKQRFSASLAEMT